MNAILSIKPEFAEKIFNGTKKYEYRKVMFRRPVDKIFVYSTMPSGKIIGEFEIEHILQNPPNKIWEESKAFSGITEAFFKVYFQNSSMAFAIKIKNPKRYKSPINPYEEVEGFHPPQSFIYTDANISRK